LPGAVVLGDVGAAVFVSSEPLDEVAPLVVTVSLVFSVEPGVGSTLVCDSSLSSLTPSSTPTAW